MKLQITVNGTARTLDVAPHATLLQVLREELRLTGTKEGCDEGDAVDSCIVAALAVAGSEVETVEGLSPLQSELSQLQRAIVSAGGVQCGFCTPGFLMTLTAFLRENPRPTPDEIRTAIAGNICRCTGYTQIVEAVVAASTGGSA